MASLSKEEIRDVSAWLKSLDDYYCAIARLVGASRIAVEHLQGILDQNDLPLGSDVLFPLSASYYENNQD